MLSVAYGSALLFGVSFALGAFFAGVVLSGSALSHKAAANLLPLQDAFAVLFFVSVGMLFEPSIIVREPLMVAGVLLVILAGKALAATGIVLALGFPLSRAFVVEAALAQAGEFSFILAGLGISYRLLPPEGLSLILAGSLISIGLGPLVFAECDRLIRGVFKNRIHAQPSDGWRARRFARIGADLALARERMKKKPRSTGHPARESWPSVFPSSHQAACQRFFWRDGSPQRRPSLGGCRGARLQQISGSRPAGFSPVPEKTPGAPRTHRLARRATRGNESPPAGTRQ